MSPVELKHVAHTNFFWVSVQWCKTWRQLELLLIPSQLKTFEGEDWASELTAEYGIHASHITKKNHSY